MDQDIYKEYVKLTLQIEQLVASRDSLKPKIIEMLNRETAGKLTVDTSEEA